MIDMAAKKGFKLIFNVTSPQIIRPIIGTLHS